MWALTCLQARLQLVEIFRSDQLQQRLEQVHVRKPWHQHQRLKKKAYLGVREPLTWSFLALLILTLLTRGWYLKKQHQDHERAQKQHFQGWNSCWLPIVELWGFGRAWVSTQVSGFLLNERAQLAGSTLQLKRVRLWPSKRPSGGKTKINCQWVQSDQSNYCRWRSTKE